MSKIHRKVTVDNSKTVQETSSSSRRRPSVFERLGPGGGGGGGGSGSGRERASVDSNRQETCRNWLHEGHCPYGSKCRFQHNLPSRKRARSTRSPERRRDVLDFEDLRHKVGYRRSEGSSERRSRDGSRSPKREKSRHRRDNDNDEPVKGKRREISPMVLTRERSPGSYREEPPADWDQPVELPEAEEWESGNENLLDFERELTLEMRRQQLQRELELEIEKEKREKENVIVEKQVSSEESPSPTKGRKEIRSPSPPLGKNKKRKSREKRKGPWTPPGSPRDKRGPQTPSSEPPPPPLPLPPPPRKGPRTPSPPLESPPFKTSSKKSHKSPHRKGPHTPSPPPPEEFEVVSPVKMKKKKKIHLEEKADKKTKRKDQPAPVVVDANPPRKKARSPSPPPKKRKVHSLTPNTPPPRQRSYSPKRRTPSPKRRLSPLRKRSPSPKRHSLERRPQPQMEKRRSPYPSEKGKKKKGNRLASKESRSGDTSRERGKQHMESKESERLEKREMSREDVEVSRKERESRRDEWERKQEEKRDTKHEKQLDRGTEHVRRKFRDERTPPSGSHRGQHDSPASHSTSSHEGDRREPKLASKVIPTRTERRSVTPPSKSKRSEPSREGRYPSERVRSRDEPSDYRYSGRHGKFAEQHDRGVRSKVERSSAYRDYDDRSRAREPTSKYETEREARSREGHFRDRSGQNRKRAHSDIEDQSGSDSPYRKRRRATERRDSPQIRGEAYRISRLERARERTSPQPSRREQEKEERDRPRKPKEVMPEPVQATEEVFSDWSDASVGSFSETQVKSRSSSHSADQDAGLESRGSASEYRQREKLGGRDSPVAEIRDRYRREEEREIDRDRDTTRERSRTRETNMERDRERNMDRDKERNVERDWERNIDRDRDRNADRERNTDRDRERNVDRDRERMIDRDRERNVERDFDRNMDRERDRDRERNTDRDRDRNVDRDRERNVERDLERSVDRDREKMTDRDRITDRDRDRNMDRDRERNLDRDRERNLDRDRERNLDRDRERNLDRDRERNLDKDRERNVERERDRNMERDRERIADRDRERSKERLREKERLSESDKDVKRVSELMEEERLQRRRSPSIGSSSSMHSSIGSDRRREGRVSKESTSDRDSIRRDEEFGVDRESEKLSDREKTGGPGRERARTRSRSEEEPVSSESEVHRDKVSVEEQEKDDRRTVDESGSSVPAEGEDDFSSGVAAPYGDTYEPISDDELEAMIGEDSQREDEEKVEQTGETPVEHVDVLDVDFASLMKDTQVQEKDTQPVTVLKRFSPGSVLAKIGVSKTLAGPKLMAEITEVCEKALAEEWHGPKLKLFQSDLGIFNAASLKRQKQRAKLFTDIGPCRRALCARRDMAIRKQLRKPDKDVDQSAYTALDIDPELYRMSIQLFRSQKPSPRDTTAAAGDDTKQVPHSTVVTPVSTPTEVTVT